MSDDVRADLRRLRAELSRRSAEIMEHIATATEMQQVNAEMQIVVRGRRTSLPRAVVRTARRSWWRRLRSWLRGGP